MAEGQLRHLQEMERAELNGTLSLRKRGQTIGAILAFSALAGGIFLLANDKSVAGYSVLLTDVAVFGGAFLWEKVFGREPESKPQEDLSAKPSDTSAPARTERT